MNKPRMMRVTRSIFMLLMVAILAMCEPSCESRDSQGWCCNSVGQGTGTTECSA